MINILAKVRQTTYVILSLEGCVIHVLRNDNTQNNVGKNAM